MKTLKVIVENPPKDCGECEFFICQPVISSHCLITKQSVTGASICPRSCPLRDATRSYAYFSRQCTATAQLKLTNGRAIGELFIKLATTERGLEGAEQ